MYPQFYRISSGKGVSSHELVSFDNALINAGISNYNLLRVSSILPAGCKKCSTISLKPGSPLLVAYGSISSDKSGQLISSAVGIGVPSENTNIGIIMEYSGFTDAKYAEQIVKTMIEESMKNHNIELDKIQLSSIECEVPETKFLTVISAVALW